MLEPSRNNLHHDKIWRSANSPTSVSLTTVNNNPYVFPRGLNAFEVYFCHLRNTMLLRDSLPSSSLFSTKLAIRLTYLHKNDQG